MKKFLGIASIILIGLIFRLMFIDKPEGLWNDEYISWMIASTPFGHGFINAVKSQCHMPFYYLYLKFFMAIFGQSDIVLRLTSVLAGILSIPIMYFAGAENDRKTGFLCAGFCAISSFLIYFSQEVRLYLVLFLFSAGTLLYTLKSIKNPDKKNLCLCGLFSFLILFTHTIGFVFVFFNLIFLSVNLYKDYKKLILKIWILLGAAGILLSPLAVKIMTTASFSQWWGRFSISKIGFLFTDYFSPVLTNLTNAPDKFLYAPELAFFMLVPALIAVIFIIKSLIKNKINLGLFVICIGVTAVLTGAAVCGRLVFITKYSIEIYPLLIYLACFGCASVKNNIFRNIIIIIYCLICTGYILFTPASAPKMRHAEGHKLAADGLKQLNLKKDDIILLQYYPQDRFEKYFDFTDYRVVSIHKGNFNEYLSADTTYNDAYKNGKNLYKIMFLSEKNTYFDGMLQKEIFDNLQPDQSVAVVVLNSVAFLAPVNISAIAANDNAYAKAPLLFLVFSYVKNKSFYDIINKLDISGVIQKGSWTIIKFTKLNT